MIKKNPVYPPIEDERILTRAPKLAEDYEKAVRTSDPEGYLSPAEEKRPAGTNPKIYLINYDEVDKFDGSRVTLKDGAKPYVFHGKTLEDLLTPEREKTPVIQLIAVFALGIMAAGGILLSLYNLVVRP